jgi:hypothetical protein
MLFLSRDIKSRKGNSLTVTCRLWRTALGGTDEWEGNCENQMENTAL